ncbi:MAG: response regulator [Syntrophaceae bacterium]|nr:response regulator [Syntrophaceae bacterium]
MPKKILIIDDEPDTLVFLGTLLKKNGYQVTEACDGVEGMKKVLSEQPDLVCLDLLMPEKTGIRMYREMRKDEALKNIPVIMVTGFSTSALGYMDFKKFIHQRSIPAPEGYIEKPIDKDEFLKAVKEVVGE